MGQKLGELGPKKGGAIFDSDIFGHSSPNFHHIAKSTIFSEGRHNYLQNDTKNKGVGRGIPILTQFFSSETLHLSGKFLQSTHINYALGWTEKHFFSSKQLNTIPLASGGRFPNNIFSQFFWTISITQKFNHSQCNIKFFQHFCNFILN